MGYRYCYHCEHEWDDSITPRSCRCPKCKSRKWGLLHRVQLKAHNAVSKALRNGVITKGPCTVCGATVKIEGHHDDYRRPLEVIWLCKKHHGERHAALRLANLDPGKQIKFQNV